MITELQLVILGGVIYFLLQHFNIFKIVEKVMVQQEQFTILLGKVFLTLFVLYCAVKVSKYNRYMEVVENMNNKQEEETLMKEISSIISEGGDLSKIQRTLRILQILSSGRKVTTKELIDNKTLSALDIKCIVLKYPDEDIQIVKELDYHGELEYIVTKAERNTFLCNLMDHIGGNTLVLFQFVEKHGEVLYKLVKDKYKDRKVFFVYGGVDTDTREQIREIVENEKDAIIVASYGTFSTGINIRNINNIVFASPSKSKIRVLQSLGRGLRQQGGNKSLRLYDIADDLAVLKPNFTLRHFKERLNIYKEQKFNFKVDKVKLL